MSSVTSPWNLFKTIVWWTLGGGLILAIEYFFCGVLWCLSIIGIPWGLQILKIGTLTLFPFGAKVSDARGGAIGCVGNVLWILTGGLLTALSHLVVGVLLCITIIGIPWGKMHFKFAQLTLAPFGRDIEFA